MNWTVFLASEREGDRPLVLDVTEDVERMVYHIPGSYHIPLGQLRNRLGELDRERQIVGYTAPLEFVPTMRREFCRRMDLKT